VKRTKFTLIVVALSFSQPAAGGGLFGDGGLIRGNIGEMLDAPVDFGDLSIQHGVISPQTVTPDFFVPDDLVSPCTVETCGYVQDENLSIGGLEDQKSAESIRIQELFGQEYGRSAQNICITSLGSCSTALFSVSGSSCFCEFNSEISVGIIQ
jgi:hypothetical protein